MNQFLSFPVVSDTITLPVVWFYAVGACMIALIGLAIFRGGDRAFSNILALVAIGGAGWFFAGLNTTLSENSKGQERSALMMRESMLMAQGAGRDGLVACIDGAMGEMIDSVCEKLIFNRPDMMAQAVALTAARLELYRDVSVAAVRDPSIEPLRERLQASLAPDRYGALAYLLATREHCTSERCDALSLFSNANRVLGNLKARTFETTLAKYGLANASARAAMISSIQQQNQIAAGLPPVPAEDQMATLPPPIPSTVPVPTPVPAQPQMAATPNKPLPDNYPLPGVESIPAVSIMADPGTPIREAAAIPLPPRRPPVPEPAMTGAITPPQPQTVPAPAVSKSTSAPVRWNAPKLPKQADPQSNGSTEVDDQSPVSIMPFPVERGTPAVH